MKKIAMGLMSVLIYVMLFTGCGVTVPPETFRSVMEGYSFKVNDITSSANLTDCSQVLQAADSKLSLTYYDINRPASATSFYNEKKKDVLISGTENKNEVNISDGQKFTSAVEGKYYVIIRQNKMVIYAVGDVDKQDSINKYISDMGL